MLSVPAELQTARRSHPRDSLYDVMPTASPGPGFAQGQGSPRPTHPLKTPPSEVCDIDMTPPRRILPLLLLSSRRAQFGALQLCGLSRPQRLLATAPPAPPPAQEPFAGLDTPNNDTPPRLARPIGLANPPRAGENSGVDPRTWAQRREDFGNWDKHLAKRADLNRQLSISYFADFSRISARHKGKSFLSPPTLFKAEKALFFPNLVGRTLAARSQQDTTAVLEGRVSVVSVFSTAWAESQCATFLAGLDLDTTLAQRVDINVELNPIKAALVKLFVPMIRGRLPVPQHERYFVVQRGLDDETRQRMGFWNGRVGYVYLLDWDCKIRWAGSGNAGVEEKAALVRGVARLGEEWSKMEAERPAVKEKKKEEQKGTDDDDDDF